MLIKYALQKVNRLWWVFLLFINEFYQEVDLKITEHHADHIH